MPRYVAVSVNGADLGIKGGPIEWDGVTEFTSPAGTRLITEQAARSGGYTMPPRPTADVTADTLRDRLTQALTVNTTWLAIPTPTAGQIAAQVTRLTKETSALIRVALGQLDTDDGT